MTAHTLDHGPFTQYRIGADGWTAEDETRLRSARPHVLCRGQAFYIGVHRFFPGGAPCWSCKAPKVAARHTNGRLFCFGCGVLQ